MMRGQTALLQGGGVDATGRISVVVPTYNQADYLAACLDSLWFQDWPALEIVVVADPSPDETLGVLAAYETAVGRDRVSYASRLEPDGTVSRTWHDRYPKQGRELIVIRNEVRQGHTQSYNIGFQAARGDYCTYVASDDLCHPRMLSALAGPLVRDEADFVYADTFIVDDAMRILREFKLPDYDFGSCFCDWYLCGVAKLYRRSLHARFGWYDPAYLANDHEFYLRLAMGGARFVHIPKTLYSIRSHDQEGRARDVHSEENWRRLMRESSELVRKARAFQEKTRSSPSGEPSPA